MAADSWSSADSRAFSPLCTASVATCRIRSAVAGDACISLIQAPGGPSLSGNARLATRGKVPSDQLYIRIGSIEPHHPLQSITPGLSQNHSRWFVQHVPHPGGEIGKVERLGDQLHALVEAAMMDNGVAGIAGGEQNS